MVETLGTAKQANATGYLRGQLLVAMPTIGDPRFDRTVIYMCEHTPERAMGLVINRPAEGIRFPDLMKQLDIQLDAPDVSITIHAGGPVETTHGFVLHSADYVQPSTVIISETIALTSTVDILKAIAEGRGPQHSLLALGYAGWGAGQLDREIKDNGWLHIEADEELVFCTEPSQKWLRAMAKLGVDVSMLSGDAGHA